MKIKSISCTQFAGIRDRSVSFTDGINIVYGKNESGKSTLVNLISRTLFQGAKLDRRSNKDFFDLYFPGAKKGSTIVGDFADGKITFETEEGTYTLSKEWGADSRCTLSTPDGVIRDQAKIDAALRNALGYGEGVYSDLLFSSQRNTDTALQTILDASKKTDAKQEITDAVTQAFSESDGISTDAIEKAINETIDEIAGKHWDFDREAPARKTGSGRWSTGLGEILKAYYAAEDARAVLLEIERLETEADKTANDYIKKDNDARNAEEAYNSFNTFAGRLAVQAERKKAIARLEKEIGRITDILAKWPKISEELEKAKTLKKEKIDRIMIDLYASAKKLCDEIDAARAAMPTLHPDESEVKAVASALRRITALENKLCGMNITAVIKMLGEHAIEIISLKTGKPIDLSENAVSITEAVTVRIPGVMEMQLSPADVNVSLVEAELENEKSVIRSIFEKYSVDSYEALEKLSVSYAQAEKELEKLNAKLSLLLGSMSLDTLTESAEAITEPVRALEEIEADISAICMGTEISGFITKSETIIQGYTTEYSSITDLKAKAFDLDSELRRAKESVAAVEDIPEEYASVTSPEEYLEALKTDMKFKQGLRETALTAKTASKSKLEAFKENVSGDPEEELQRAERVYDEKKSLLSHWLHIREIFTAQKETIKDNPMEDIANNFAKYLAIISAGKVSSDFPEADKLNMNIYSDNRLLDFAKLSEGTKETVSLAFRLAVLDHLFPNGGGVIVFDDPFTDMDDERTRESLNLIKECAKRHQVIFLTCKTEYANLFTESSITL